MLVNEKAMVISADVPATNGMIQRPGRNLWGRLEVPTIRRIFQAYVREYPHTALKMATFWDPEMKFPLNGPWQMVGRPVSIKNW